MSFEAGLWLFDFGLVGEDDGESAWQSMVLCFGGDGACVNVDVQVDGYSGQMKTKVLRDDIGLEPSLVDRLFKALHRTCSVTAREMNSEQCAVLIDLEPTILRTFYQVEAEILLRKLRTAFAAAEANKLAASST